MGLDLAVGIICPARCRPPSRTRTSDHDGPGGPDLSQNIAAFSFVRAQRLCVQSDGLLLSLTVYEIATA